MSTQYDEYVALVGQISRRIIKLLYTESLKELDL